MYKDVEVYVFPSQGRIRAKWYPVVPDFMRLDPFDQARPTTTVYYYL